jgi:hypothetical protein
MQKRDILVSFLIFGIIIAIGGLLSTFDNWFLSRGCVFAIMLIGTMVLVQYIGNARKKGK